MVMKVCVGSANPSKIKGVEAGFREMLGCDVDVVSARVDSGVPPQPIGFETIVRGARNRALNAMKAVSGCDYGVGVEAGIFSLDGVVMDVQAAVIVDSLGRESVGFSPSFPLPRDFGEKLLKGEARELEVLVDGYYGTKDIGEKGGFIRLLTRDVVLREDLTRLAVIMALVPWVNPDLYGFGGR
jgi:inosine/xanthosine triphosphatase